MLAIISVLASPGTPSRMQWPWQNRAISTCLRTSCLADDHLAELRGHRLVRASEVLGGAQVGLVNGMGGTRRGIHGILGGERWVGPWQASYPAYHLATRRQCATNTDLTPFQGRGRGRAPAGPLRPPAGSTAPEENCPNPFRRAAREVSACRPPPAALSSSSTSGPLSRRLRLRPILRSAVSTRRILTSISSPILTTSSGLSTLWSANSEMCSSPSRPGSSSTKTPKLVSLVTLPFLISPGL